MLGLVQTELAAVGNANCRRPSPALFGDGSRRFDALLTKLGQGCVEVIAHQIELVRIVGIRRMHGQLGRREREDGPATAGIHRAQRQHVAKERTNCFSASRVYERVNTGDHVDVGKKSKGVTARRSGCGTRSHERLALILHRDRGRQPEERSLAYTFQTSAAYTSRDELSAARSRLDSPTGTWEDRRIRLRTRLGRLPPRPDRRRA